MPLRVMDRPTPSAKELREHFRYNKRTGLVTWRKVRSNNAKVGAEAGTQVNGRRLINFGLRYPAASIIWCLVTGEWPKYIVDHKDGDHGNNRWPNLREATHLQNQQNHRLQSRNTSGYKGVSWEPRGWVAQMRVAGTRHWIGRFQTPEAAYAAYEAAEIRLRGEFRRENPNGRTTKARRENLRPSPCAQTP